MKKGEYEDVSNCLYMWFIQRREKGIPVCGVFLKQKALDFYIRLQDCTNIENIPEEERFTASDGWPSQWKNRCEI